MKITKKLLSPADDYSWAGNTAESIVLHITAGGSYTGAEETLKIRHLSYHFIIEQNGNINQLVELGRSAWHAGIKSNPKPNAVAFFGSDNPNKRSIGISFVCPMDTWSVNDLTEAQVDSAVWLIKDIGRQTGVRYNESNIFTHGDITDYKEQMYLERSQVIQELAGYKDEKDVCHVDPDTAKQLQAKIDTLKLALKMIKSKYWNKK